ncbi:MAG: hypothetical protein ABSB70_20425 [Candidatus Velthaea sp.]|jgi:hypothetical protein
MTDINNSLQQPKPPASASGPENDAGRTVLVGVLGGIISAAGYLVYQRLPDDQRDRLHRQVRGLLESRLNEIRQNFNI